MTSNLRILPSAATYKIRWSKVLDAVTEASIPSLRSILTPGAMTTTALVGLFKDINETIYRSSDPREQAWALICMCFIQAVDSIRPEQIADEVAFSCREILRETESIVDNRTFYLEPSFFLNPTSLPIYLELRPLFIEYLSIIKPGDEDLEARFDISFGHSLYKLNAHYSDLITNLRKIVCGDGIQISQIQDDWKAYQSMLQNNFALRPMFGQEYHKITLKNLYVKPRAFYSSPSQQSPFSDQKNARQTKPTIVDLHMHIDEWLRDVPYLRAVKVISGTPGSGKSTFAKALAFDLSSLDAYLPIFIELQRLPIGGDLLERMKRYLVDHLEAFSSFPIDKR
jgi:hypothetical protein